MKGIPHPIYSRRKRFLPEYRELFTALLNIPDKDVRDRVTDAINGFRSCPTCKTKKEYMVDVATQTEDLPQANETNIFGVRVDAIEKSNDVEATQQSFEKRRRKRKRTCPKVVKTAQHSNNIPVLKQEPNAVGEMDVAGQQPRKLLRTNSFDNAVSSFFDENIGLLVDLESPSNNLSTIETLKQQMKIEWEIRGIPNQSGLLPIHEAIVRNELQKLKRQIYVWKFLKRNLNDLVTEDNDNLIQLAVKENCFISIIDELLKENLRLTDFDDENNNIIHLAVLHLCNDDNTQQMNKFLDTLETLLKKVDLEMLLHKNNDGLTPLHIAVKKNQYLMAEKILSVVDEKLNLKSVVHLNDACANVTTFLRYYCNQCESFKGRETNDQKQAILNATDMKSGGSVLYFAMESRYDHLIYLLLAHMCNPTIKNLSGLDAKTYYAERGTNAGIVSALEKVATALQKKFNLQ